VTQVWPGASAFAKAWVKAVAGTGYVPMAPSELEAYLHRLTEQLADALCAEPMRARSAYEIGTALVAQHISSAEALGRTVEIINLRLLRDLGMTGEDTQDRLGRLLGALTTGYARALRDRTLDEQESIRRAAFVARQQAELALRASEARFRHQATHDSLTGLPNRALFTERLELLFGEESAGRIGLCFIDLDGFKVINDSLGHQVGDLLLVALAGRLGRRIPDHLVARLGGDEFVILVEDSPGTDDVVKIAEVALAAIAEPVRLNGHELTVSGSVGIVERPVAGTAPTELMRAADITLSWAKAAGRGRWALFDPQRNEREVARFSLSAAMPAALDRGEFFLEYQPIVSLTSDALLGVEALVRWRHPQLGVLRPDRFVDIAEETGLIVRLGSRMLAYACEQASRWPVRPDGPAPFVSVNLAVRQVRDAGLVADVTSTLDRTGLPPERLQLELTESAVMSGQDDAVHRLRRLADLGIRIAIDDFGTGWSNLSYLRNLPVTALKIDGSFVAGIGREPVSESILATLVSLAHTLGLTTTAEGVETAEQAAHVRALGCAAGQGYYFGAPAAIDALPVLESTAS
jgi:diguanylate cyclase (GGDEF)-like protein